MGAIPPVGVAIGVPVIVGDAVGVLVGVIVVVLVPGGVGVIVRVPVGELDSVGVTVAVPIEGGVTEGVGVPVGTLVKVGVSTFGCCVWVGITIDDPDSVERGVGVENALPETEPNALTRGFGWTIWIVSRNQAVVVGAPFPQPKGPS